MNKLPIPVSRKDVYQDSLCRASPGQLPEPIAREDYFYDYLCNPTNEKLKRLPEPIDREDHYLHYLCLNGVIGARETIGIGEMQIVDRVPSDGQTGKIYAVRKKEVQNDRTSTN